MTPLTYDELLHEAVTLRTAKEEAESHAKRLEEYMLKGVAFRDELQAQLCAAREVFRRYVNHHGGAHYGDCPEDDTCACDGKPINDAVNAFFVSTSPCRKEEAKRLREQKDDAYTERNRVVALLSAIYPSHLCIHDPNDTAWENDWRTIVCIHSPNGQLTWHLHDSHVPLFDHLEMDHTHWDGHTTEEKYRRVDELRRCVGQDLGIKVKELEEENRRLLQSNLELLDEQRIMTRDLRLWREYGDKRQLDVADLLHADVTRRRAGGAG
jgi:hypothetical protein